MCEFGTDKATCPNCPKPCQGHKGRDYQQDLEVVENLFKEGAHAVNILNLVRDQLPWYIKRCMELESQLHQAEEREAALRYAMEMAISIPSASIAVKYCLNKGLEFSPSQPSNLDSEGVEAGSE